MAAGSTKDARPRMIDAAVRLLATRGYQATSFSEVLALSGAPRGSIYHHFPDGKDQLIAAALTQQGNRVTTLEHTSVDATPVEVVDNFAKDWRMLLVAGDFAIGCALLGIATSAGAGALSEQAGTTFGRWIESIAELFRFAGVPLLAAQGFATVMLSSIEGAVAISRAQHSIEPFDVVVSHLRKAASQLPKIEAK